MVSVLCDMKLTISTTKRMAMNTLWRGEENELVSCLAVERCCCFVCTAAALPSPSRPPTPYPHAASHLPRHDGEESTQASRLSQIRGHPPVHIHALGPGTLRRHGFAMRCVGV